MTTVTTERDGSAQTLPGPAIPDLTLPQFVLCSANRRGSKRALVDAATGQEISYAGLADAVQEIGAGLSARGLHPGDVLALCAPNSIEFAVAWFAVASIGAIVTTVNPQCTRDEIVRQLRQTGARWLVTTAGPTEQKLRGVTAETAVTETIVTGDHAAGTIPFWSLRATGQPGELLVRTAGAMRGYLGDPEATAATIDAAGWVHTGDIVTAGQDGWFRVADRVKELIKYKGYQVAPAELESVLLAHPAVADAAVVRKPDALAGEVPKAFVVLRAPATAEDLMTWVAEYVAGYKRVRQVVFTDSIPRSPAGKILRRLLVDHGHGN